MEDQTLSYDTCVFSYLRKFEDAFAIRENFLSE